MAVLRVTPCSKCSGKMLRVPKPKGRKNNQFLESLAHPEVTLRQLYKESDKNLNDLDSAFFSDIELYTTMVQTRKLCCHRSKYFATVTIVDSVSGQVVSDRHIASIIFDSFESNVHSSSDSDSDSDSDSNGSDSNGSDSSGISIISYTSSTLEGCQNLSPSFRFATFVCKYDRNENTDEYIVQWIDMNQTSWPETRKYFLVPRNVENSWNERLQIGWTKAPGYAQLELLIVIRKAGDVKISVFDAAKGHILTQVDNYGGLELPSRQMFLRFPGVFFHVFTRWGLVVVTKEYNKRKNALNSEIVVLNDRGCQTVLPITSFKRTMDLGNTLLISGYLVSVKRLN